MYGYLVLSRYVLKKSLNGYPLLKFLYIFTQNRVGKIFLDLWTCYSVILWYRWPRLTNLQPVSRRSNGKNLRPGDHFCLVARTTAVAAGNGRFEQLVEEWKHSTNRNEKYQNKTNSKAPEESWLENDPFLLNTVPFQGTNSFIFVGVSENSATCFYDFFNKKPLTEVWSRKISLNFCVASYALATYHPKHMMPW